MVGRRIPSGELPARWHIDAGEMRVTFEADQEVDVLVRNLGSESRSETSAAQVLREMERPDETPIMFRGHGVSNPEWDVEIIDKSGRRLLATAKATAKARVVEAKAEPRSVTVARMVGESRTQRAIGQALHLIPPAERERWAEEWARDAEDYNGNLFWWRFWLRVGAWKIGFDLRAKERRRA